MGNEKLELRMYGLVPYNISPIQQGIQFGHSKDEMTLAVIEKMMAGGKVDELFYDWLKNWKTYIILNGGTTNKQPNIVTGEPYGTLNQHLLELIRNGIYRTRFTEIDLGDQLTAITFIVDERVWDREKYPDFKECIIEQRGLSFWKESVRQMKYSNKTLEEWFELDYISWKELIGGDKNVFLREFLKPFKLA
jgi:hypothetical protein